MERELLEKMLRGLEYDGHIRDDRALDDGTVVHDDAQLTAHVSAPHLGIVGNDLAGHGGVLP